MGLLGTVVGVVCLIKRKGPIDTADDVIKTTKEKIKTIDAEAKAKAAEAAGAETAVVKEVKRMGRKRAIPDSRTTSRMLFPGTLCLLT